MKPNHHGIALNNARVIEDFSKVLEQRNQELDECIDWLCELLGEWDWKKDVEGKKYRGIYKELESFYEKLVKRYREDLRR